MTYFTANNDRALDAFYADMTNANVNDMLDDMAAADADYSPVPAEYAGMAFAEIVAECDEYAAEMHSEAIARYWNSRL